MLPIEICSFIFSFFCLFFISSKLIIFGIVLLYCYIYLFSFLHTKSLHVPYAYISIKSIGCYFYPLLKTAILLISSVKVPCFFLLNLYFTCNINLLFFYKFFMIFFQTVYINFVSRQFILSSIQFLYSRKFSFRFMTHFFFVCVCLFLFSSHHYCLLNSCMFLFVICKLFHYFCV